MQFTEYEHRLQANSSISVAVTLYEHRQIFASNIYGLQLFIVSENVGWLRLY